VFFFTTVFTRSLRPHYRRYSYSLKFMVFCCEGTAPSASMRTSRHIVNVLYTV
jgi:hypothetical protein